ncbi:ABC transporter substrate-binding protein [Pseudomonas aeruginosa]|uniref:ABC transporter substrate-binding protein n=1 Tax=Pseudomonas aeruginosa TaxID=287 RepID=UPI000935FEEB|nr:spermidine/putrescine ABC transporter substrate-binding protein [Pseudomonas aeruginosa]MCT5519272.1 spermidine/putrescine ABC transporter substrate-binding protein [Pseudomonas aeruginosa]MEE2515628.1 spermidine/putrescine ABC transporter substrate-binding protein [Pseudomonas aeruginosa]HEJ1327409.1 spermidine/putrescine ABC transporter substrate-binding protein [Pseudomonas aeruginosa]
MRNRQLTSRHLGCLLVGSLLTLGQASAAEELHLYNWGDYINPEVLTRFTKETGIKVSLDTYSSNEEMLAKLQAGATGYDVVFPSVHMQDSMAALGLLEKTDINQSPAFKNIDPAFLRAKSDSKGEYCMPYAWGTVGIVYNKTKVSKPIESWADFFDEAKQGKKVILLDDMRETLGVGLIANGKSVNSTDSADIKLAEQWILERKPLVSAFTYESIPMVQSGDVAAAHWFVGALMYTKQNPDEMTYVIPKEGATMYQEDICVLKSAPNKGNAKRFMEFFLRPEIAVLNTSQQMNGTPNLEARKILPPELRDNPNANPPPEVMAKLQIFQDLGKDLRKYDRAWTRVRTAN